MTQKKSLKAAKSTRLHQIICDTFIDTKNKKQGTSNKTNDATQSYKPCPNRSYLPFYAMGNAAIYESSSLLQKSSVSQSTAFL